MAAAPARRCPTCGAPFGWRGQARVVECRYCQSHVDTTSWATTNARATTRSSIPSGRLLSAGAVVGALVVGVLTLLVLALTGSFSSETQPTHPSQSPSPTASDQVETATSGATSTAPSSAASAGATADSPVAEVVLTFGEPGSDPGQLNDPRAISVAPDGRIVVADYRTLRVQVFDQTGKHLRLIKLRPGSQNEFIHGVAAGHAGHVWVARGGDLLRYSLATGTLVTAKLHKAPRLSYGSVAAAQDGTIYVQNFGAGGGAAVAGAGRVDSLRRLDATGRLLGTWKSVGNGPVAVDGTGNAYAADRETRRIDVLDAVGKLTTRIGGTDQEGWDISSISSLAADGQGHLFVLAGKVHVVDLTGREIAHFDAEGARALAMGPEGFLYAATIHSRVIKWRVTLPPR